MYKQLIQAQSDKAVTNGGEESNPALEKQKKFQSQCQWLILVILLTQEAEIRRTNCGPRPDLGPCFENTQQKSEWSGSSA
jgi:hypothetical protein